MVATEVRSLAQRSATAAREISALIQDSVEKVEAGSTLVNQSGQTLQEIVASVKQVTNIIGEIAAGTQEQSAGIDQVNLGVNQMDHVVQSNAAQTEQLSATAHLMAEQGGQLQALVRRFKLGDESQAQMRAAAHAYEPTTAVTRPKSRIGMGNVALKAGSASPSAASLVDATTSREKERFEEF